MGFLVGLVVNFVLILVPIGASLGSLFAIQPFQDERAANIVFKAGQDYNHIYTDMYCGEFHEFAQNKQGNNYTINSNEVLPAAGSTLCTTIIRNQNSTYDTATTVPEFSFLWSYPFQKANAAGPKGQPVQPMIHAVPQISIADGGALPMQLQEVGQLGIEFKWTMATGNDPAPETSELRLGASQVNSSVTLDMYLDNDQTVAGDASKSKYEVIVYFAKLGLQQPVGWGTGQNTLIKTVNFAGYDFDLYAGPNSNQQSVFSWVSHQTIGNFGADLTPFIKNVIELPATTAKQFKVELPTYASYLGYAGFGTQAYNSIGNVTFYVPHLEFNILPFGSATVPVDYAPPPVNTSPPAAAPAAAAPAAADTPPAAAPAAAAPAADPAAAPAAAAPAAAPAADPAAAPAAAAPAAAPAAAAPAAAPAAAAPAAAAPAAAAPAAAVPAAAPAAAAPAAAPAAAAPATNNQAVAAPAAAAPAAQQAPAAQAGVPKTG